MRGMRRDDVHLGRIAHDREVVRALEDVAEQDPAEGPGPY